MTDVDPAPAQVDVARLSTEGIDARYRDLDTMPTRHVLAAMNEAEASVPAAIQPVLSDLATLIETVAERMRAGGRLIYVGAGTSGRLGALDAAECPPTFHTDPALVQAVLAGGPGAMFEAVEGAEDDDELRAVTVGDLDLGEADTVLGITASGRTPFVLGAIRAARTAGAFTVGLACNTGSELARAVDHPLEVDVGPEVLAGSTRLKAGSATKQVLNMLSTGVMIRLGKTYRNLMVDLRISNGNLRDRGERLLMEITGADRDRAAQVLTESGSRVTVAALMLRRGLDRQGAEEALEKAQGSLSQALGE